MAGRTEAVLSGLRAHGRDPGWFAETARLLAAASPGTANHGRGAAVDIAILAQNKAVAITSNPGVLPWLIEHADEYGLSWELQSEPWHLRVVGPAKVKPININVATRLKSL